MSHSLPTRIPPNSREISLLNRYILAMASGAVPSIAPVTPALVPPDNVLAWRLSGCPFMTEAFIDDMRDTLIIGFYPMIIMLLLLLPLPISSIRFRQS